jgi:hypothetical protein
VRLGVGRFAEQRVGFGSGRRRVVDHGGDVERRDVHDGHQRTFDDGERNDERLDDDRHLDVGNHDVRRGWRVRHG